jgi:hypothetical protein
MPAKQTEIPGTERPTIQDIETAASAYTSMREKWQAAGEKLTALKTELIQVVMSHEKELIKDKDGNRVYRFDDLLVILKPGKPGVKVKNVHEEESEDED